MSKPLIIRWLVVCLIPLATLAVFVVNPPEDEAQHLINGIILACEATFLFKFILFETIKHHLKQEFDLKRQTMLLFYSDRFADCVFVPLFRRVLVVKGRLKPISDDLESFMNTHAFLFVGFFATSSTISATLAFPCGLPVFCTVNSVGRCICGRTMCPPCVRFALICPMFPAFIRIFIFALGMPKRRTLIPRPFPMSSSKLLPATCLKMCCTLSASTNRFG